MTDILEVKWQLNENRPELKRKSLSWLTALVALFSFLQL
jgi:hypothetical protein